MNKRDFKGIWIPKEIWLLNELNWTEKLLLSHLIYVKYILGSELYYEPEKIAELFGFSKYYTIRLLKKLIKKNKIRTVDNKREIVLYLQSLNLDIGYGNKRCSWCGIRTVKTHKHHYPIPKSKGGTKIVNICPNCHSVYHYSPPIIEIICVSKKNIKQIVNEYKKRDV